MMLKAVPAGSGYLTGETEWVDTAEITDESIGGLCY